MYLKQCLDHFLLNIRSEELSLQFIVVNFFEQKVNLMYLDCCSRNSDVNQTIDSGSQPGSESRDAASTDPVSVYKSNPTSCYSALYSIEYHNLSSVSVGLT